MRAAENDTVVYSVCSTMGGTLTLETRRGRCWRGRTRRAHQAGRSGQCVTFFAAADEKRITNLVGWLLTRRVSRSHANPPALTYAPAGPYSFVWCGSSAHCRCATVRTQRAGSLSGPSENPTVSHARWYARAESFKPWKSRVHGPRRSTEARRHSSPYCEIDTATFDDRHNIHGSLPMVSANNTSIKNMVSNAENQVVGRCAASNQALRRALRNPSCTMSIFQNSS